MAKAVSLMMTLRDFENGYWYLGLSCGPRRFPSGREPAAWPDCFKRMLRGASRVIAPTFDFQQWMVKQYSNDEWQADSKWDQPIRRTRQVSPNRQILSIVDVEGDREQDV